MKRKMGVIAILLPSSFDCLSNENLRLPHIGATLPPPVLKSLSSPVRVPLPALMETRLVVSLSLPTIASQIAVFSNLRPLEVLKTSYLQVCILTDLEPKVVKAFVLSEERGVTPFPFPVKGIAAGWPLSGKQLATPLIIGVRPDGEVAAVIKGRYMPGYRLQQVKKALMSPSEIQYC